ncbi:MAG: hypothetical protein LBD16_02765 [Oscillospiraceae bacterium]|jgi:spore maturation protein A|nr:hypothetical protein [Oscillospiraceae bacterium]
MMNYLWAIMGIAGIAYGIATGRAADVSDSAMKSAVEAVQLCVRLAGGFALWSGLIAILEKTGAMNRLARLLNPVLSRLFPATSGEARRYIALNFTANALGLGNAATPLGLSAMRSMSSEAAEYASDAMIMFLVINASSLQLFPTTVVSLRAAAGSSAPASILAATLVSTGISTAAAIASCLIFRAVWKKRTAL